MTVPSEWVQSIFARSSSCIIVRPCKLSLVVTLHIKWIIVRSLRCRRCNHVMMGLRFRLHGACCSWCTNYDAPDAPNSSSACDRRWVGGEDSRSSVNLSHAIWNILMVASSHSHHLTIGSPWGNSRITPPQTSPYLRPPLSLVCHLLVWPVQYTVYTWSWDQASEDQGYHCIQRRILVGLVKRIEPWPRYQDLSSTYVGPKSLSVHLGLPEDQLLLHSLQRFNGMTRSSAHKFPHRHPVWNSWERASRTVINSRALRAYTVKIIFT